MKYRPLGKTGVQISEIGFGCGDNAGLMVEGTPEARRQVVEKALAAGINYFDTADHYGAGKSETNLGNTLREIGTQPFVATKVRFSTEDMEDLGAGVRQACEGSLRRLGMEQVDLFYLHTRIAPERRPGPRGPGHISVDDLFGPVWEAFAALKDEGKIRFIGICTSGSEPASIRAGLEKLPFDVIQAQYSLLNPTEGRPPPAGFQGQDNGQTIELAGRRGIGVVAYRALAAGALARRPGAETRPSPSRGNAAWLADIERAAALEFLKADGEEKLAGAAVRYVLANPDVSSVLLGFSKPEYIDEANVYSEAGPLSPDLLARIDTLYASDFGRP